MSKIHHEFIIQTVFVLNHYGTPTV